MDSNLLPGLQIHGSAQQRPPLDRRDFRIGIICALSVEAEKVLAVFDQNWDLHGQRYGKAQGDRNTYTVGRIGSHDVVLAHMPAMGKVNAATVASNLKRSYRHVEIVFVVGICGAVPSNPRTKEEIILGDCIFAIHVLEHDLGRRFPDKFQTKAFVTETLGNSALDLKSLLSKLQIPQIHRHLLARFDHHLRETIEREPTSRQPARSQDKLYESDYKHLHHVTGNPCNHCDGGEDICPQDCDVLGCDDLHTIPRRRLSEPVPTAGRWSQLFHIGSMASGDTVMKSGKDRDNLARVHDILGFEMEGAGAWNVFPTVILKAACDYADSHKNKNWQSYAATCAAAALKAFLEYLEMPELSPKDPVSAPSMSLTGYSPGRAPLATMGQATISMDPFQSFQSGPYLLATGPTFGTRQPLAMDLTSSNPYDNMLADIESKVNPPQVDSPLSQYLQTRVRGTTTWLFDNVIYRNWIQPDVSRRTTKFLWLCAPAGCGKTTLAASVIAHLVEGGARVLHYFSSMGLHSELDNSSIARYWISDIAEARDDIRAIRTVAEVLSKGDLKRGMTALGAWKALSSISATLKDCIFVLDGINEHKDTSRIELLNNLKIHLANCNARILITSREEADIRLQLQNKGPKHDGILFMQYSICQDDTRPDIKTVSRSIIEEKLPLIDLRLKEQLARTLSDRCDGMFLWMKIVSQQLNGGLSPAKLRRVVDQAPTGLGSTYQCKWNEILAHPVSEDRSRAFDILRWCMWGYRPLTLSELSEALVVSELGPFEHFDFEELPPEIGEDYVNYGIKLLCGSFIEIRSTADEQPLHARTVHIIHSSVQEFLTKVLPVTSVVHLEASTDHRQAAQHCELFKICIRYLQCTNIHRNGRWAKHRPFSFYDYAAEYWLVHGQSISMQDTEFCTLACRFLNPTNKTYRSWAEGIEKTEQHAFYGDYAFDIACPMYFAAMAGLLPIMVMLHHAGYDPNAIGGVCGTSLQVACFHQQFRAVKQLLDWRVDTNMMAGVFGSALAATAVVGNVEIMQTLLDHGANVNSTSSKGLTPLLMAVKGGHVDASACLLRHAPDLNIVHGGLTPLFLAACQGNLQIVKLLLEHGANPDTRLDDGMTALGGAALGDSEDVIHMLIDKGADVNSQDSVFGATPMLLAAVRGCLKAVRALFAHGGSFDKRDYCCETPLQKACRRTGNAPMVELLLDLGAHIETGAYKDGRSLIEIPLSDFCPIENPAAQERVPFDNYRLSPLLLACELADLETIKLLVERKANVNYSGKSSRTALHVISCTENEDILRLLLLNGANPNAKTVEGYTPLHIAAAIGREKIVQLLLEYGADLNSTAHSGATPLCQSIFEGSFPETISLLLERGADPDQPTCAGWTPLMLASHNEYAIGLKKLDGNIIVNVPQDVANDRRALYGTAEEIRLAIVKLLLKHGAKVNVSDDNGFTALDVAISRNKPSICDLLLDAGAQIEKRGAHGLLPFHRACLYAHTDVIEVLLHKGANVTSSGNKGASLLHNALLLFDNGYSNFYSSNALSVLRTIMSHVDKYDHETSTTKTRELLSYRDEDGRTAIHLSSASKSPEVIDYLLSIGADLTVRDYHGKSVLHYAAAGGSKAVLSRILELCASEFADMISECEWSLVHWASRRQDFQVLVMLREAGYKSEDVETHTPRAAWSAMDVARYCANSNLMTDQGELQDHDWNRIGLGSNTQDGSAITQRVFANSLAAPNKAFSGYCNGCLLHIYGPRWHCLACRDTDYCFMCSVTGNRLHAGHEWTLFEPKRRRMSE